MIVLRTKRFADEEDKFLVPRPFELPPGGKGLPIYYDVVGENVEKGQKPTTFMKERDERIKVCDGPWKDSYKPVLKSIKMGFIYSDRDPKERTHYYPDEGTNDIYYVSKDINGNDRLMYDIHKPVIEKTASGDDVVIIKIQLRYCSGHTHRNGKKFSETQ